jgi:hypothetical protein
MRRKLTATGARAAPPVAERTAVRRKGPYADQRSPPRPSGRTTIGPTPVSPPRPQPAPPATDPSRSATGPSAPATLARPTRPTSKTTHRPTRNMDRTKSPPPKKGDPWWMGRTVESPQKARRLPFERANVWGCGSPVAPTSGRKPSVEPQAGETPAT